jgi:hypothetical protein
MRVPTFGIAEDSAVFHPAEHLLVETWWWSSENPTSPQVDNYLERRWDMTKWDRLLAQLDKVFGFENRARSTVKKRRQGFDEKTKEHVFIIEYWVVMGEHSDPKKRNEASIERRVNREEVNSLLRDINDRARLGFTLTP